MSVPPGSGDGHVLTAPGPHPAVLAADVFSPDAGAQHDAPKRVPGCPGRLRRLAGAVVSRLPEGGSRQEGDAVPRPILDRLTGDLAAVIDVVRRTQLAGVLGGEVVEVGHDIVLPDESPADGEIFRVRHADDLSRVVDAESLAEWIIVQCAEILDLPGMLREKRPRTERSTVGGRAIGEAHDMPSSVDRHRRVPGDAAQVSDLDRPPFFHSTMRLALSRPNARSQMPEIPTTSRRSLIAVAELAEWSRSSRRTATRTELLRPKSPHALVAIDLELAEASAGFRLSTAA